MKFQKRVYNKPYPFYPFYYFGSVNNTAACMRAFLRLRTTKSLMDEKRKGGVLPASPEYMPFIGQMKAILTIQKQLTNL